MIIALTLIGRLLSFVRNVFLANTFGIGIELDAYLMAFTLPMLLFLVIPGALNAIFIPTLKGMQGEAQAVARNALFHKVLTLTALAFLVVTLAGMYWAAELTALLAPGFSAEKQALTAELLRLMMPSALFIGIIAVLSSVLNAHYEFFAPTLGTIINGAIVIISLYTLVPMLGIHGIAWGTTIGYVLYAIYLFKPTFNKGYTLRFNLSIRDDAQLRSMGERLIPVMIGIIISQLYLIVERVLASGLGDQKVTVLSFALGIVELPIAIFAGALAIPLFPLLSEHVKNNEMGLMKETLQKGLLYQYHVLLPAVLGFMILSQEIVGFFYDYSGNVSADDIALTAWAMVFYSFSMIGRSGRDLLLRASYAIENTKTPVMINAVSMGVYILGSIWLVKPLDYIGLALSYTIANTFNLIVQSWFLQRQIGPLYNKSFYISMGKGILGTAVMSAIILLMRQPTAMMGKGQVIVLIALGAIVYGGMLLVLKETLFQQLVMKVWRRFKSGGGTRGA